MPTRKRELRREAVRLVDTRVGRQEAAGRRAALVEGASQRPAPPRVRSRQVERRQEPAADGEDGRREQQVQADGRQQRLDDAPGRHLLPDQEVEGEAADRDEHGHDDDGEERRVQAVAPGRLAVAAGPVAGERRAAARSRRACPASGCRAGGRRRSPATAPATEPRSSATPISVRSRRSGVPPRMSIPTTIVACRSAATKTSTAIAAASLTGAGSRRVGRARQRRRATRSRRRRPAAPAGRGRSASGPRS